MKELRIISLIASSTETICALGFEKELVGISHECDYPPSVLSLPQCSQPKFDVQGSSLEIDKRVRDVLQNALSVYKVDVEKLKELNPTVIVTQDHCEVCAVNLKDVEEAACEVLSSRPRIVSLAPNTLADIYQGFRQISSALEAEKSGEQLIARMQKGMEQIVEKARSLANKPRVAFLEWIDPIWTSGSWLPELIKYAGGIDRLGKKGEHSHTINFHALRETDAEIMIIAPCGYDIPKAQEEMSPLVTHPEWKNLRAVKDRQVYIVDGNQYFNRPGPRLLDSLKILAEIIHPESFDFGYKEKGWIKWKPEC